MSSRFGRRNGTAESPGVSGPKMAPADRNSFQILGFGTVVCWLLIAGAEGFAAAPAEREPGRSVHMAAGQLEACAIGTFSGVGTD